MIFPGFVAPPFGLVDDLVFMARVCGSGGWVGKWRCAPAWGGVEFRYRQTQASYNVQGGSKAAALKPIYIYVFRSFGTRNLDLNPALVGDLYLGNGAPYSFLLDW